LPHSLSFAVSHSYETSTRGVTVPVSLRSGADTVKLFAKVDTGAEDCLFDRGFGEALGIEVERGVLKNYATVAGEFRAYGHELTMAVLGVEVHALVYFYDNPKVTRHVLGRNGWLNRVRLGLVDHNSVLFLSAYDE